jgi:hypothetical protein
MWSFIAQYWNKVCMLLAGVTQHARFHPFRAFCVGPCSGKAQYLGVYPRATRLSTPHTPSCRKFHCLKLDSLEHQMCGLMWVGCCELPGLPGQQHCKIGLGTMLHDLSVFFHTGLFFQWKNLSKRQSLKNWEMKLFLGIGMAKSSFKKKGKVSRLPYLVLVSTQHSST